MKLCLSLPRLQCLARYRMGGQHLEGRLAGRSTRGAPDRACRLCSRESDSKPIWWSRMQARCGAGRDEDLLHFMLECPAYDHIREAHPSLFAQSNMPANDRLLQVFNHDDQARLVSCVWSMDLYRAELLGITRPADAYVHRQPEDYVPSNAALRCAADIDTAEQGQAPRIRARHKMLQCMCIIAGRIALMVALLFACLFIFR